MKKLFCALLSLTMLLGLGTVALAADEDVSTESTLLSNVNLCSSQVAFYSSAISGGNF